MITSPLANTVVSGVVPIAVYRHTGVVWANVYIDGGYLASTPNPISWVSTSVANGKHTISSKAFNQYGTVVGTCTDSVLVQNSPPLRLSPPLLRRLPRPE